MGNLPRHWQDGRAHWVRRGAGERIVGAYDGGERLGASAGSGPHQWVGWTIRDLEGPVLREFVDDGTSWTWTKDYIWGPTGLLATNSPTGGIRHFVNDHLGSPRRVCDRCSAYREGHTYWPYGEELTASSQTGERIKFTGHERDLNNPGSPSYATDDLDYMHARHFNLHLGRFLSTDPIGGSIASSQSWNRYSYVNGNPLRLVDPMGLAGEDTNGKAGGCDEDSAAGDTPCIGARLPHLCVLALRVGDLRLIEGYS